MAFGPSRLEVGKCRKARREEDEAEINYLCGGRQPGCCVGLLCRSTSCQPSKVKNMKKINAARLDLKIFSSFKNGLAGKVSF